MLEQAIAAVAAAMADPSRVKMLCALMDGRAWTATELSAAADVAPSTASGHLARLVEGKLIICLSQGRHRYYRLAGHDVAALVEQMMGLSWSRIAPPETTAPKAMRDPNLLRPSCRSGCGAHLRFYAGGRLAGG